MPKDDEDTEITPKDMKDGKKLVKKLKNIAITAGGGVAQKLLNRMLQSMGDIDPAILSGLQAGGFAVAGGATKNKMASRFFAGGTATAAADAMEGGLQKLGILGASTAETGVLGGTKFLDKIKSFFSKTIEVPVVETTPTITNDEVDDDFA